MNNENKDELCPFVYILAAIGVIGVAGWLVFNKLMTSGLNFHSMIPQ